MKFILEFDMDNAAFDRNPEFEVAKILEKIGADLIEGLVFGKIRDLNGNQIGSWKIK